MQLLDPDIMPVEHLSLSTTTQSGCQTHATSKIHNQVPEGFGVFNETAEAGDVPEQIPSHIEGSSHTRRVRLLVTDDESK